MANTTNYNWETPDDTDLVKDGAAAIRTLGSSIDTTTKALNPETTLGDIAYRSSTANTNTKLAIGTNGQVLTVAGGVPSWATPTTGDIEGVTAGTGISGGGTSGTVTITNSMATAIDAKGDLIVGTGADTFSRLAVGGTNGHILTVDSAEATGMKWAAAAGGGKVLQVVSATYATQFSTTSATMVDTGLTLNITPSSTNSKVLVLMTNNMGAVRTGDDCYYAFDIRRGTTTIFEGNANEGYAEATQIGNQRQIYITDTITYLDSPATTSATTYKVRIRGVGGSTAYAQYSNDTASLILLEIGA